MQAFAGWRDFMTGQRVFLKRVLLLCAAVVGVISWGAMPEAQTMGRPEKFTAAAVDMNTGQTGRIEISVTRWSTPGEREALLSALFKEGQDELLSKLKDMRAVGRIYTPGSIGYELRFAEAQKLPEGGRRIVLATDRPMSFWELINRPRSSQYPFTWIQLNLKPDGTGDGELAVAARVFGDRPNRPIEVETFQIQPVRLQSVTASKERDN
jgi:hypothetical protein